jgi:tetratricopeptide (TPR) repeat protein
MINPPQTLIAFLGLTIILVFAFILRKRRNLMSFIICWFLGNLVIESTVVPLELVYEHRTYLPGVLIFSLMSMGIVYLSVNILKNKKFILFTSLLLILYGNGTYLRNYVFKTPISMWFDVVQKSPNLARAHGNLGKTYMDLGHNLKARESLEKALELDPDCGETLVNLGKLYFERFGMKDEAMTLFKKAQRVTPKSALGCMALGDAYFKLKNYQKAEHFYKIVLLRLRFYVPAINNLGIVKIHLGKTEEAIKLFQFGISVQPAHEPFYLNLAKLHANENRFSNAINILRQYQVINANSKEAKKLLKAIEQKAVAATAAKG